MNASDARPDPAEMRFARPEDADAIAAIHVQTWRVAYRGVVPDEFLDSLSIEKRATGWRRGLEADPRLVLVAEISGCVEGWVAMGRGRDEDVAELGEVFALYVKPELWGAGLGRALMTTAEDELRGRGYETIVLWVLEQNPRARRFYELRGFAWDGATKEITLGGKALRELRYRKPLIHRG